MVTLRRARSLFVRHLSFLGPGLVAAVAYVDPGNWATDLQAGADYGYKLLFIVFLAGLAAVVLQILSVRLGAVTSSSLPKQTRLLFERLKIRYPRYRLGFTIGLWSLYVLAEIAIIATDLAELLGSAIALNLLFPRLPLFAGVIITAADVMIVLLFFRSDSGRQGMMLFEIVIVVLVLAVFISFMILLHLIQPEWRDVFLGLVPSKTLIQPGALYIGVGIIGATVMPHALFLGSSLASVDRLNMLPVPPSRTTVPRNNRMPRVNPLSLFRRRRTAQSTTSRPTEIELDEVTSTDLPCGASTSRTPDMDCLESTLETPKNVPSDLTDKEEEFRVAQKRYEAEVRAFDRIEWVDVHVLHATIDTCYSLLGFALTINSAILTLAGAAFYYGQQSSENADLAGAYELIKNYVGKGAALIFALALLCAGQSASITATLAGQIVSEGFIEWKTSPLIRRLLTRLISVIPAAAVAVSVGNKGLDNMLVASQVVLSIVLPTVTVPLVYLCSSSDIMSVDGPIPPEDCGGGGAGPVGIRRRKSYASPRFVTGIGYALCGILIFANGYVIVQLCLGNS